MLQIFGDQYSISKSQFLVRAITQWRVGSLLTITKEYSFAYKRLVLH